MADSAARAEAEAEAEEDAQDAGQNSGGKEDGAAAKQQQGAEREAKKVKEGSGTNPIPAVGVVLVAVVAMVALKSTNQTSSEVVSDGDQEPLHAGCVGAHFTHGL